MAERKTCDVCGKPVGATFVDGKVKGVSSWATMCERCFGIVGVGLGTGKGQRFNTQTGQKLAG